MPSRDRYLLVNAYYRGGSSVIDFSDPTRPKEIAFADMEGTNTWSAYTYPRRSGEQRIIPVYSNHGLSRNSAASGQPADYRETAYGFQSFQADVGPTDLVGFNRLNPQLQERVIEIESAGALSATSAEGPRTYATGERVTQSAVNRSARPYTK